MLWENSKTRNRSSWSLPLCWADSGRRRGRCLAGSWEWWTWPERKDWSGTDPKSRYSPVSQTGPQSWIKSTCKRTKRGEIFDRASVFLTLNMLTPPAYVGKSDSFITLWKCRIVCLQMSIILSLCSAVIPSVFGLRNITFHVGQGGSKTPESRTEQNPVKLKEGKRSWELLSQN